MKKQLFFLILISPFLLKAQEYKSSIGFRGGESFGFTYRIFNNVENAAEALLSFRDGGMQLTAMKEIFNPALLKYSDHIFLYQGYGGHLGYSRWHYKDIHDGDYFTRYPVNMFPLLGIDGLIGIEYRIYKYPLTMDIGFKPFAELGGRRFFKLSLWDFGFTVRYTFDK